MEIKIGRDTDLPGDDFTLPKNLFSPFSWGPDSGFGIVGK